MTCYLTREAALEACLNLKQFYDGLKGFYNSHGLDIESNRGRRNILMSEPMERFFADQIAKNYSNVISDGRTGKADISFDNHEGFQVELECKLTSPHESSGSIAFQTDYDTLLRKGKLDYLYLIADPTFDAFCCIYFEGLTVDDFRMLSPGARGKVQMYKHKGMKKATVLVGHVVDRKQVQLKKLNRSVELLNSDLSDQIKNMKKSMVNLNPHKVEKIEILKNQIENTKQKYDSRLYKLKQKIIIKNESKSSYSFEYEEIKNEVAPHSS